METQSLFNVGDEVRRIFSNDSLGKGIVIAVLPDEKVDVQFENASMPFPISTTNMINLSTKRKEVAREIQYALSARGGGRAITMFTCEKCGNGDRWSDTGTPPICGDCAMEVVKHLEKKGLLNL